MRVAHLNSIRSFGGGEKRVMRTAAELRMRGHENRVYGKQGSELQQRCAAEGFSYTPVPFRRYYSPSTLGFVARTLRADRPDALVCWDQHAVRVGAVAAALLGKQRPRVVYYQGLEGSFANKPYNRLVTAPRIDLIIANAQSIVDELRAFGWIPEGRLSLIYDGVDPTPILNADPGGVRSSLGYGENEVLGLVVARLVSEKGHAFLLEVLPEVLRRHAEFRLLVAGTGPEEERLRAQIERLGLGEGVQLLGFRRDVPALLRAVDLLVHPSKREGAPNAVREAMVAGLPVVAVAASGTPELVRHGETGLLSPIGDAAGLQANLLQLLQNPDLRRRMGEAGSRRAAAEFSEERCADAWEAALQALLPS